MVQINEVGNIDILVLYLEFVTTFSGTVTFQFWHK